MRDILRNPIYNGWVRRRGEPAQPAPWRAQPPIPDELWERVARIRAAKVRGGGGQNHGAPDPLRGLLYCPCGRMIRADGSNRSGRQRSHPEPCRQWTGAQRRQSRLWEEPVKAQLRGLEVSDATIVQVVAALSATVPVSDDLRKARRERQRKELALAYAAGKLSETSFLSAVAALNAEGDPLPPPAEQVTTTDVSRFLRKVSDTITKLDTSVAVGDISPTELGGCLGGADPRDLSADHRHGGHLRRG